MFTNDELELINKLQLIRPNVYEANYDTKNKKRLHYWIRVMGDFPTLAIRLIMSGYCDNAFFQKKMIVMTNTECVIAGSRGEYKKNIELVFTMYDYILFIYATDIDSIDADIMQQLKYASQKNRVVQQISRGRLILALKHYFKEGPYYPVDDTNSIYGKEYRKAMVRLGNK